jgi:hypothetical protein
MSHFSQLKTKMNDPVAIIAALEELGFKNIEIHEKPKMLNSIWSAARQQQMTAHIVVNTGVDGSELRSEFGFLQDDDKTYQMIGDRYYQSINDTFERLPMLYGKHVVLAKARELGHQCTVTETIENGRVVGYSIAVEQPTRIGRSTVGQSRLSIGGR